MIRAASIRPLALLSALILASPAESRAQAVGGGRASYGGVDLLGHPLVRGDLKLDAAQLEKAKVLPAALHARQAELFAQLEGLAGDERTRKAKELNARLAEEQAKALADFLETRQLDRFRQIDLQQRGASSWLDSGVAADLKLTSEQSERLAKVLDESMVRRREAQSSTRGDRRASLEKVLAIRKETDERAVDLLTDEQRATWRGMTGPYLELYPPRKAR